MQLSSLYLSKAYSTGHQRGAQSPTSPKICHHPSQYGSPGSCANSHLRHSAGFLSEQQGQSNDPLPHPNP